MSWVGSFSIKKLTIVAAIVGGAAGLAGCAPYGGAGYGYYGPSAAVYSDYGYGYGGGYYGGYYGGYRPRYYGGGYGHYRPGYGGRPGGGWNRPGGPGPIGGGHIGGGPRLGLGGAAMPSRAAFGGGGGGGGHTLRGLGR